MADKKKKAGIIRKTIDKIRKKVVPTFGEQFTKARSEDKKTFTSTRDDTKKGKLEYATTTKKEAEKALEKTKRIDPKTGGKRIRKVGEKYEKTTGTKVSKKGQAFAAARKAGKKEFTFEGKKYHTKLKGEKEKKPFIDMKKKVVNISKPELSGKTSKKIKKFVRGNTTGYNDMYSRASANTGGLIKRSGYRGGGLAVRGFGRAMKKGGKV